MKYMKIINPQIKQQFKINPMSIWLTLLKCPRYSAKVKLLYVLPTLLLAGGACGDSLGGLLLLASILAVFKIEFSFEISSKSGKKQ